MLRTDVYTSTNVVDFLYDHWNSKISSLRSELKSSTMDAQARLDITSELWAYGIALASDLDRDEERVTGEIPQKRVDARHGFFMAREFETKAFLAMISNPEDSATKSRWRQTLIAADEALARWIYT